VQFDLKRLSQLDISMKLKIALLLTVISIGIHTYLTIHYYDLNYGRGAVDSVCNISATLNCDAVAASKYSTLFKMPLALWGAVTNLMLLLILLGWIVGWTDDSARLGRYTYWYSLAIAGASVVMGAISFTSMSVFCIFCIAAYIVSFLTAYLIGTSQDDDARPAGEYLRELATSARFFLVYILGVPVMVFIVNNSFASKEGPKALERLVKRIVAEYKVSTPKTFATPAALVKGASDADAKIVLTEFADFLCGHCRTAAGVVNAFLSTRPEVQVRFHFFPLDNACNEAVTGGRGGVSCVLAKAVACAEENSQKGWGMHDKIFADQDEFNSGGMTADAAKIKVAGYAETMQVQPEPFKACLEKAELQDHIKKMSKEGADNGVKGTPTFFMNGKLLEGGQLLPVLEAVYREATNPAN
jgi:protein-disulfide isomerase/uncharacterized membrane protein